MYGFEFNMNNSVQRGIGFLSNDTFEFEFQVNRQKRYNDNSSNSQTFQRSTAARPSHAVLITRASSIALLENG